VTLGEAVGFSVPAITGVAVTSASWGRSATFVAMVLAGSVEGALLGTAQADCLYRWAVLPTRRRWIIATSVGAAVAWSLAMLPSTIGLHPTAGIVIMVGIGERPGPSSRRISPRHDQFGPGNRTGVKRIRAEEVT
jgi:hypothetical protein